MMAPRSRRPIAPQHLGSIQAKGDGGSASAELVVLTPLLIILISVCFIAGRLVLVRQQLDDIARTASEAASVGGSPAAARYAATVTAVANLITDGIQCKDLSIVPGTADVRPGGTVSVTVSCTVLLSHLAFAGLPGSVRLSATRVAFIEPYRQLGP